MLLIKLLLLLKRCCTAAEFESMVPPNLNVTVCLSERPQRCQRFLAGGRAATADCEMNEDNTQAVQQQPSCTLSFN